MNELEDFKDSIRYIIGRIWENALLAKEDFDDAKTEEEKKYHAGRLEAYWEVFDTLGNEIEIQEIDPDEIDFHYNLNEISRATPKKGNPVDSRVADAV